MPTNRCPVESIAKVTALNIALLSRDLVPSGAAILKCSRIRTCTYMHHSLLFGVFASVSAKVAHDKGGVFEVMNKQRIEAGKSK